MQLTKLHLISNTLENQENAAAGFLISLHGVSSAQKRTRTFCDTEQDVTCESVFFPSAAGILEWLLAK